jgi:hypothetical protein
VPGPGPLPEPRPTLSGWSAPSGTGFGPSATGGVYVPSKPPPSHGLRRALTVAVVVIGLLVGVMVLVANRPGSGAAETNGNATNQGRTGTQTGGGTGTHTQGGNGSDTTSAESQAKGVDALLTDSVDGRKHVLAAIDDATACDNSAAIDELQVAAAARRTVLRRARDTDMSALPGGGDLKDALVALLDDSYRADAAYLDWVQAADGGCPATSDPSFAAVQRANDQARRDKTTFLTDWNPVAARFGLPARDVKDI